jgi:putative methionine-R-sulfoxide reductase with GAF domain/ribosomal protein L37E
VTQQLTSAQRKPILDAESFQRILAAAFVLQEHNDRQPPKEPQAAKEPQADYTQTLSEIVETQKLIQTRQLDLPTATALIAQRLQKMTGASGVAVGIVEKDQLAYGTGIGSAASDVGSHPRVEASLAAYCVRNERTLRCPDTKQDSRLPAALCRQRGVGSLVAVPVFQEERVAGIIEVRFARANAFDDSDVRTAELMAALVAEAIARTSDLESKKETLAAERATILQTLERIKPQLERLAGDLPAARSAPKQKLQKASPAEPATIPVSDNGKTSGAPVVCRACGHQFEDKELYCGSCGIARSGEAAGDIQSKWASLWYMQQAAERNRNASSRPEPELKKHEVAEPTARVKPVSLEEIVAQFSTPEDLDEAEENESPSAIMSESEFKSRLDSGLEMDAESSNGTVESEAAEESEATEESDFAAEAGPDQSLALRTPLRIVPSESDAGAEVARSSPWTSARKSREWLESLRAQQRPKMIWLAQQWQVGRANIYIGVAALLLLIVFGLWVAQPSASGNSDAAGNASIANARRSKRPPQPKLTLFEDILVGLGLAEPPPQPVYLGNPDAQVWVDLHTALYYCPGSELYGKTPGGKMTTQRDAQQDQFEPANRRVCD